MYNNNLSSIVDTSYVLQENRRRIQSAIDKALSIAQTPEMLPALKSERAALRKEFDLLEAKRKTAKSIYLEPWEKFESEYKKNVSELYNHADTELKKAIDSLEKEIKSKRKEELLKYFTELCQSYNVPWLKYDDLEIVLTMSDAKSKNLNSIKAKIKNKVKSISNDCEAISKLPESEKILAVYMETLNCGESIAYVNTQNAKIQQAKAIQANTQKVNAEQQQHNVEIEKAIEELKEQMPKDIQKVIDESENDLDFYVCRFALYASRQQLIKIKEFFNKEHIKYETI